MRTTNNLPGSFRGLNPDELYIHSGSDGFAYDAGRGLRFLIISGGGTWAAVADYVANIYKQ